MILAASAAGCSSSNAAPSDAGADVPSEPAPSLCSSDPRAQSFTPGLEGTPKSGAVDIKLATVSPTPPIKGNNEWTIEVSDASGNPVDGLALDVVPYMPDHRHGTSIVPTVTPLGGGKYDITLLNLFMPGIWTVTIATAPDAGAEGSTVFTFCIDG